MERAIVDPGPLDFGSIISEHNLRREYRMLCMLIAAIGISTAAISGAIGIYRWYFAYRHYGPAAVTRWSGPAIGISFGCAILGFIGLACLLHLRGSYAKAYAGGILVHRGRKTEKISYDQIQAVSTSTIRYGLPWFDWGTRTKLTLHLKQGRRVSLTECLNNLDQLAITVKQRVYPGLLNQYRKALQEGHAVQFGSVQISTQGIYYGKRMYPWSEIGNVSLERGLLAVHTQASARKRAIRISVHRVPNIDLCFQLIQHFFADATMKQRGRITKRKAGRNA